MIHVALFFSLILFAGGQRDENLTRKGALPEVTMTVPEIIAYYQYPVEIFDITTEDGYILQLHRIPFGRRGKGLLKNSKKPVMLLQHGLIASSADWVANLPSQSAGFVFADAGFDVWMGNSRGNWYSRKHANLSTHSSEYWQFTFDEMAKYDLPAMVNAILRITGQDSLYYTGHSQGTEIMFAKLASDVEFSKKIRKFFALAPVATITHIRGLIAFLGTHFGNKIGLIFNIFGPRDFLAHNWLTDSFAFLMCGLKFTNPLCDHVLFQIGGPESNQLNNSRLLVYMEHTPAGTSTCNMVHWVQMNVAKQLQKYDYGSAKKNMQHYGQPKPPAYNLTAIQTPTYLYYSPADWLADDTDVQETILAQINKQYLKRVKPMPDFNHFDFIWGLNARKAIYDEIVKTVRRDFVIRSANEA